MKNKLLFLGLFLVLFGGLFSFSQIFVPLDSKNKETIVFQIKKGENLFSISENLKNEKIIKNKLFFQLLNLVKFNWKDLQAGEYELSPSMKMFMRMRFIWWPFHPAGYAISMTYGVEYFWSCLVISTLVKWIILRFAGLQMHRKAVFFFFGVILGEYCVGAFWSAISVILRYPVYDFAPG